MTRTEQSASHLLISNNLVWSAEGLVVAQTVVALEVLLAAVSSLDHASSGCAALKPVANTNLAAGVGRTGPLAPRLDLHGTVQVREKLPGETTYIGTLVASS